MTLDPRPDQQTDPPAAVLAPGGAAGVFRGRLVIIFGSANGVGLFVYSPTPGSGTLKESIAAAFIDDPYGNPAGEGFSSYTGNTGTDLFMSLTDAGLVWGLNSDLPTGTGALAIANGVQLRIQNSILATDPNAASTPESWHTVTNPTGWTGTSRVRILAEAKFAAFDYNLTGAGAGVTFGNFPSADYYPTAARIYPISFSGGNAGTNPRTAIPTSGAPTFGGLPGTTPNQVSATIIYPLD